MSNNFRATRCAFLGTVFVCAAVVLALLLRRHPSIQFNGGPHASAAYQGKPLEVWFKSLPITPIPPPNVDLGHTEGFVRVTGQNYGDAASVQAVEAFKSNGTNCVPLLLAKLRAVDSLAEKAVTVMATNAGVTSLPFRQAELERMQAVTGLIELEALSVSAASSIAVLRTNSNTNIALAADYVLRKRKLLGKDSEFLR